MVNRGVNIAPEYIKVPDTGFASDEGDVPDNSKRLLVEIFKSDPLTNKPMNDLVLTENSRLAPEIREFIKQNLQAPVSPDKAPIDYQNCDDLCRKDDETQFQYIQRLRQMSTDGFDYVKETSKKVKKLQSKK